MAQLFFERAFTGEENLYFIRMARKPHRFEQIPLAFFFYEPARRKNAELIRVFLRLFLLFRHEYGVDAVGDHAQILRVAVCSQLVGDEGCRAVNVIGVLIKPFRKYLYKYPLELLAVQQPEMAAHVFRLNVERRRDGLIQLVANAHGGFAEGKGHQNMHNVALFDAGAQYLFVRFGKGNAVLAKYPLKILKSLCPTA